MFLFYSLLFVNPPSILLDFVNAVVILISFPATKLTPFFFNITSTVSDQNLAIAHLDYCGLFYLVF